MPGITNDVPTAAEVLYFPMIGDPAGTTETPKTAFWLLSICTLALGALCPVGLVNGCGCLHV